MHQIAYFFIFSEEAYAPVSSVTLANRGYKRLISANVRWTCHIDQVSRKVSRAIGIINSMKKTFPISTL